MAKYADSFGSVNVLLVVRDQQSSAALVQWSLRLAGARAAQLSILRIVDGSSIGEVAWGGERDGEWWASIDAVVAAQDIVQVQCAEVHTANVKKSVLTQVAGTKAGLLVLQDRVEHPEFYRNAIQLLMDTATCAVMILRLGEGDSGNGKILLPCAGGLNSKRGLQIAAEGLGKEVTAFLAVADVDEFSKEVGEKRLERYLKRSGVKGDEVGRTVVVSDDVPEAIRSEVYSGDYGMLLIGASDVGTMRRKLFGTVPDRMLRGSTGMSVGVLRAERPLGHKIRHAVERLMLLNIPQLSRTERIALFEEIEDKSGWSFDFASLMLLATSIAALGLLANSGAVVIGAMLVAPLMTPLLGGGLALAQGNLPLWKKSQKAVWLGFVAALAVGMFFGFIARMWGLGLTDELIARSAPSLLDLGVAFISGIAASYCLARPKISGALAGVAIAAALVPPIATVGVSIALLKWSVAQGAAVLFGTNVVAIVLGSAVNFFFAGIRGKVTMSHVWARRMAILFTLILVGLMVPLSSAILKQVSGRDALAESLQLEAARNGYTVSKVTKHPGDDGVQVIEVTVDSKELITQEVVEALQQYAQAEADRPIRIRVITRLIREAR